MNWEISVESKEYVPAEVIAPHDPITLPVDFAFTEDNSADDAVWHAGSWEGPATTRSDGTFLACALCLVGPGEPAELDSGTYVVHVRITDNPEIPVKRAGVLTVV